MSVARTPARASRSDSSHLPHAPCRCAAGRAWRRTDSPWLRSAHPPAEFHEIVDIRKPDRLHSRSNHILILAEIRGLPGQSLARISPGRFSDLFRTPKLQPDNDGKRRMADSARDGCPGQPPKVQPDNDGKRRMADSARDGCLGQPSRSSGGGLGYRGSVALARTLPTLADSHSSTSSSRSPRRHNASW